jgi:hypothetical protein
MLIVEFDGISHYQSASRILKDADKDADYESLGYKVVRIPYFIQPSTYTIKVLFGLDVDYYQVYPHGFIDKKATLPSDYCYLGIQRFKGDLLRFAWSSDEVIASLKNKVDELGNIQLVLPYSLNDILDS